MPGRLVFGTAIRGGHGVLGICSAPPVPLRSAPPVPLRFSPPDVGGSGVERLLPRGGEISNEQTSGTRVVGKRSKAVAVSLYVSTTSAGKNARAIGEC